MAETKAPSVKKYVDYANQQVDEQAILDKYNAATLAQFNVQREQNRQNENAFYNQMYNTQKTAMDTIRQSNAAAVSSGASRGVQAANELSAILGLQSESVAQATELAQANRQTAQEETAAVLENVLKAYQQSAQERSQLVSQGIEAASVDAQEAANEIAATEAQTHAREQAVNQASALVSAAENGTASYIAALQELGKDYTGEYSIEGATSLQRALSSISYGVSGQGSTAIFTGDDWKDSNTGADKAAQVENDIRNICNVYGITYDQEIQQAVQTFKTWAAQDVSWMDSVWTGDTAQKDLAGGHKEGAGKSGQAEISNLMYQNLLARVQAKYASKNKQK